MPIWTILISTFVGLWASRPRFIPDGVGADDIVLGIPPIPHVERTDGHFLPPLVPPNLCRFTHTPLQHLWELNMTVLPELVESMVLFIASGWVLHLYRRVHFRALLFAATFIVLPAIGLLLQVMGASTLHVEFSKWVVVSANFVLTCTLVRVTWHDDSPTSQSLDLIRRQEAEIQNLHEEMRQGFKVSEKAHAAVTTSIGESNSIRIRQLLSEVPCG